MKAWLAILVGVLLLAALCAPARGDTAVRLRSWAKMPAAAEAPLTLGDVAEIEGDGAAGLGAIVIHERPREAPGVQGGWLLVDVAEVRAAMDKSGAVNWSRVTLSGSRCSIRVGAAAATQPAAVSVAQPEVVAVASDAPPPAGSIREAVLSRLADLFGVAMGDLRAKLTLPRASALDLDAPAPEGTMLLVEPGASSASGSVPVRLEIYRGERLEQSHTISADVHVRRQVTVTTRTVERGEALDGGATSREERWVSPGGPAALDLERAMSAIARKRLPAGTVLSAGDVQSPVVVNRGDEVWVHVLSGELRMKIKARAMGSARDGEVVKMQVDGSKKTFEARMSGRGNAVKVIEGSAGGDEGAPRRSVPAWQPPEPPCRAPAAARETAPIVNFAGERSPKNVRNLRDRMKDNASPTLRARWDKEFGS